MKLSLLTFIAVTLGLSSVLHAAIIHANMNGLVIWGKGYTAWKSKKYSVLDSQHPDGTYLQQIIIYKDVKSKNGKQSSQVIERIDNVKQLDGDACEIQHTINQVEKTYHYSDCRRLSKLIQSKLPDDLIEGIQSH